MRYASLFTGIGCAEVAWMPLGWEPVVFSEIDPFASAVLSRRFPDVPNVGDVTKHDWSQYHGKIDLVIGGFPCQSHSVAGRRKGLDDPRGQLTLEFARVCNAIDPAWIVGENVPGILSVKDAFGSILGELAGASEPLRSGRKNGRWPDAGLVVGPKRAIAFGALDAQYFGVPQRRKRIFLLAVALSHPAFPPGKTPNPAEALFIRESLFGNPSAGGKAGQEAVAAPGTGAATGNAPAPVSGKWPADVAPALDTTLGDKQGLDNQHIDGGAGWFVPDSYAPAVAGTVTSRLGTSGADENDAQRGMLVSFHPTQDPIESPGPTHALGCGSSKGQASVAVAFTSKDCGADEGEIAPTLRAMGHDASHMNGGGQIAVAAVTGDVAHTLSAEGADASEDGTGRGTPVVAVAMRGRGGGIHAEESPDLAFALRSGQGGADKAYVATRLTVRRLTPRECERLQGLPDDWTLIPYGRGKSCKGLAEYAAYLGVTPEVAKTLSADSLRYKACGNGMATPVVWWIGRRIEWVLQRLADETPGWHWRGTAWDSN